MENIIRLITNPSLLSVIILCILCLRKVNVLLSIILATLAAGLLSGMNIKHVMDVFISGMGGNSETALSYILLGAFAASMTHTGLAPILSMKIANAIQSKKYMLIFH